MTATEYAPEAPAIPTLRGGCPFDPPSAYEQLRDERPVSRVTLWDGSRPWLVTRHRDARAVLSDQRFSADSSKPGFPFITRSRQALSTSARSLTRMDDPEHARLRRMLVKDFNVKSVDALRPGIQSIADEFLDRMTAHQPPADLVTEFALPFSSKVICLLLGVPYSDHAFFQQHTQVLVDQRSTAEEIGDARKELDGYLLDLAAVKKGTPDDGIISRLVAAGELAAGEIVTLSRLLVIAGHETTANMTALGTLVLLRNPDQLAQLRDDGSLVKGAVEELLRYLTVVQFGIPRVALEDVEIDGHTIGEGEGVVVSLASANRDTTAFPGGAELDIRRDSRRHVAFSYGMHPCLGHALARAELQVAFATLLRRLPNLSLAVPFEDIRYHDAAIVYGVEELPVTW